MFPLQGRYADCIVYTDSCSNDTIRQIYTLLNQKSAEGSKIRIMPDCHVGKSCVIGTTMTVTDRIIPNLVSGDIGCGMTAVKFRTGHPEWEKLDSYIRQNIPAGAAVHSEAVTGMPELVELYAPVDRYSAERYLGTLGGGNHFIEVDRDSDGGYWLIVHSGSRKAGQVINRYYQDMAYELLKAERNGGTLKELTRGKSAGEAARIKAEYDRPFEIPYEMAWLIGEPMERYLHDAAIAERYAALNRLTICRRILKAMKWKEEETVVTVHNTIGTLPTGEPVIRKGSVSAEKDEILVIPMNMRDGVLLCRGKGNPDWNHSAPHGAGRLYSRADARSSLSMKEYREAMEGIYTSCISASTLDESPMAYKPMEEILRNVGDTVEILDILKPVYNFKAGKEA